MSLEYEIHIEDRNHTVEVQKLDEDGTLSVKVDDGVFTLKPSQKDDESWSVSDASEEHTVRILKRTGTKISLELDGQILDIEWSRARKSTEVVTASTSVSEVKRVQGGVYPPMPGKITEVRVKAGDSVDVGQTVCILEAMKMFNELKAAMKGTVKEVNVEPGSSVSPNDILVLIS